MADKELDYYSILAALEARREVLRRDFERRDKALVQAIQGVRLLLAESDREKGATGVPVVVSSVPAEAIGTGEAPVTSTSASGEAMKSMTVRQAIQAYLGLTGRPQTSSDIARGLLRTGVKTKSEPDVFSASVSTLLRRLAEKGQVVKRSDGTWALPEWGTKETSDPPSQNGLSL